MATPRPTAPEGIAGSTLPGPFGVGAYARKLQAELRKRARVQLVGEVAGLSVRATRVYFELRDASGAIPCAMWRDAWDELGAVTAAVGEGTQVVAAGGPDYYPGSRTASPAFSFHVTALRVAGEGDLLAQVQRLRRRLDEEGLLGRQALLARPALPRTIGVVTGETGKARDDVLAGLQRRGWTGRLVWAFAPVQDRRAAPAITRALQDLAALAEVEVIVVARGGGSFADLLAFCDETLCRTVALLGTPVISSVGHHTDRTLLDDVAAVCCSTPTHAAEAAVPLHPVQARAALTVAAGRLAGHGRGAVLRRARHLAGLSRVPAVVVERQRTRLHQLTRELRASATRRGLGGARDGLERTARTLEARAQAAAGARAAARRAELEALTLALGAHEPARVLDRGYAIARRADGEVVTSATDARAAGAFTLAFGDGEVPARVADEPPAPGPGGAGPGACQDRPR